MDTNIFRRFQTVVETGSFNKAAELLNVSQPALSKSIQQLESYYDTILLNRGARGISPTEHGLYLLGRYKLLSNELDKVTEEMRAMSRRARRRVMIGAPPSVGYVTDVLVEAVVKLCSGPEPMEVGVRVGSKNALLPLLETGDIDLFVGEMSMPEPEGIVQELLLTDSHVFVISADHPLSSLESINLKKLADYTWIVGVDSEDLLQELITMCGKEGVDIETRSIVHSHSSLFIASAVAKSDFVGIASAESLASSAMVGTLKRFWISDIAAASKQVPRDICVSYRANAAMSSAVRLILNELRRAYSTQNQFKQI